MAFMTAEQAAEAGKSLTFEKVWASLMETEANMKRMSEETDKLFKEFVEQRNETNRQLSKLFKEVADQQKETDRQLSERFKETDRRLDKVSKNIGGLNGSRGELVESLIAARLWEKFKDYNLKRAYRRVPIYDETGRIRTDIDILLSDADCAMAVEVKRELNKTEDVDRHQKRMELIRQYPPAEIQINRKRLLGAMAGGAVDPDVGAYAYECGFFVLELTGEAVHLMPPPAGFTPKEWM